MKRILILVNCAVLLLLLAACSSKQSDQDKDILSQRHVHKYGYLVSKEEWEAKNYPGQIITNLSSGVTITATYENALLHGPMTCTFPHSQNIETYYLYNWGECVKEITYNTSAMPIQEKIQLSPSRFSVTTWYFSGSPKSVEEFAGEELVDGQYYTTSNEIEMRVEKGRGMRILRDIDGVLLSKEEVVEGYTAKKETFYPSKTPESFAFYHRGILQGEKKTFAPSGEPLSIEHWENGELQGLASYFKNGTKYLEITYRNGEKNGTERHFVDGDMVSQEISWEFDMKHGPSTFYYNGKPEEQQWFYGGKLVSKMKFDELSELDSVFVQR